MKEITTIAQEEIPLNIFSYREVISMYKDKYYLNNVNILLGKQIIKKIRFEEQEKPYNIGMGKQIAIRYLKEQLCDRKEKERRTRSKAKRPSKKVIENAAINLIADLGL